jgi:hypothetical protein
MVQRKMAAGMKPDLFVTKNGNSWTLKSVSTLKTTEVNATEGVEFDEETLDGRKCKSLLTNDGTRLTHVQKDASTGAVSSTIVREVVGDKLVMTLTAGSVTCKRFYKKA